MFNQHTKFEVSTITCNEETKGNHDNYVHITQLNRKIYT